MRQCSLFNVLIAAAFLFALAAPAQPAAAQDVQPVELAEGDYVPGQVVVLFEDGLSSSAYASQATALAETVSAQVVKQSGSAALLGFDPEMDLAAMITQIQRIPGVRTAEPNIIVSIPFEATGSDVVVKPEFVTRSVLKGELVEEMQVPIQALQQMKSVRGKRITATYPNDPNTWSGGWTYISADIVWSNKTASKNVCVLDTGVDYLHKDLAGRVIKGIDIRNYDMDPMDDHGHGTHVAGIIVANQNNKLGMAGISTGKVVAVKVLDSQGIGTSYDVAEGINYCAGRTDVNILNLSLGSDTPSVYIQEALYYAVNMKGKLVVAAAGNADTDSPFYPAAFAESSEFIGKILSVAAAGYKSSESSSADYDCKANYSNYGSWVNIIAPGTDIYSTLPWDRGYTLKQDYGFPSRYGYLSGTSMAAPYVSAVAARAWGYKPLSTNNDVYEWVRATGMWNSSNPSCWPSSMDGVTTVNVAAALERGAAFGYAYDATTLLPLTGATIQLYKGTAMLGAGTIYRIPYGSSGDSIFPAWTEIINLYSPWGCNPWEGTCTELTPKINKSGYTNGPQEAFMIAGDFPKVIIYPGYYNYIGDANVPQKSGNFSIVAAWLDGGHDMNLVLKLPFIPKPVEFEDGQPAEFMVGKYYGFVPGEANYLEGDSTGTLSVFPFARWMTDYEGGSWNAISDTIVVRSRPGKPTLPYYTGSYFVHLTDYGQYNDNNDNGIEDEGDTSVLTGEGARSVFVWQNGKILTRVNMNQNPLWPCNNENRNHIWTPLGIYSTKLSTVPEIFEVNDCLNFEE